MSEYLMTSNRRNLSLEGIKFILPKILSGKLEHELSVNILIDILKIFLPSCIGKTTKRNKTYWELESTLNAKLLVCVNIMNRLFGETKNYVKEEHLFQKLCDEAMEEKPLFSPKEVQEIAEFHLDECKFLLIVPEKQTNNLEKSNFCYNFMFRRSVLQEQGDKNNG